jgi:hypothetical protein
MDIAGQVSVLGIDLGKSSRRLVGLDGSDKVILRRRMQRKRIAAAAANLRIASLRWKFAVVLIILDGFAPPNDTQFGRCRRRLIQRDGLCSTRDTISGSRCIAAWKKAPHRSAWVRFVPGRTVW